jgi:hypothetical protein
VTRLALLLVPCALACSPEPPSTADANVAGLRQIVADVDQARLGASLGAVVAAHEADTPIDCTSFHSNYPPYCHLSHAKARDAIRAELEAAGLAATSEIVSDGAFSTESLVWEKRGETAPGEVVLVGAHYDAFWSGADDNSSAVAALLEAARVLSTRKFDRTIRLVFFDLEELGFIGSTRHVARVAASEKLRVAIILDCIGFFSSEEGSQKAPFGFAARSTGDFLAVIGNEQTAGHVAQLIELDGRLDLVEVQGVVAPADSDYPLIADLRRSDHAPFWDAGLPAVFVTDTANFRNPNYHQPSDKIATLDVGFMARGTKLVATMAAYWAGGPR